MITPSVIMFSAHHVNITGAHARHTGKKQQGIGCENMVGGE